MSDLNFDASVVQLVSYPRTGSHYVRIVLEDCIGTPCAPTSFFGNSNIQAWGFHLHDRIVGRGDEGLTSGFDRVVYLYRNPIDTIFSHIRYQGTDDWISIAQEYKNHLQRWLHNSSDCKSIIYKNYDDILREPLRHFTDILDYIDCEFDENRLISAIGRTTIGRVKALTEKIDNKVVNDSHFNGKYIIEKSIFISEYGDEIQKMFDGIYVYEKL